MLSSVQLNKGCGRILWHAIVGNKWFLPIHWNWTCMNKWTYNPIMSVPTEDYICSWNIVYFIGSWAVNMSSKQSGILRSIFNMIIYIRVFEAIHNSQLPHSLSNFHAVFSSWRAMKNGINFVFIIRLFSFLSNMVAMRTEHHDLKHEILRPFQLVSCHFPVRHIEQPL